MFQIALPIYIYHELHYQQYDILTIIYVMLNPLIYQQYIVLIII